MIYVKTAAGRLALKDRSEAMPRKYHFPFLMCDGVRDSADILTAESQRGFTAVDLEYMVKMGFIAPLATLPAAPPNTPPTSQPVQSNAEQFAKLKKNASHYLEDVLGPNAERLCLQLEECKTKEAFDITLQKTVHIVAQMTNPAKAEAYQKRVLAV
jgi:hypothetical protein